MNDIFCTDALPWLAQREGRLECCITSLPDANELGLPVHEWVPWYKAAALSVVRACTDTGAAVFFQTDRKHGGRWHSKAALTIEAAAEAGAHLLWHRIVLRRPPGSTDLHRPAYSHLMAFSREGRPGRGRPDVLAPSASLYPNGMPVGAALAAVQWAQEAGYRHVVDPFCGRGTVPYYAAQGGLEFTAMDIDPGQVEATRELLSQLTFECEGGA